MRFSVITPTLDRPDTLLRAIQSVQAQTYGDWEHIIVDVGTTPVRMVVPDDPRVRYFRDPPAAGPALDFQKALGWARGEIIHPLADDDTIVPHALERVDQEIGGHSWLLAATEIFNEHGHGGIMRGGSEDSIRDTANGSYMLGGAVYWKKTLTDQLGGFDPAYDGAADFALYRKFIRHSAPAVLGEVLYLYNDHPGTDSRRHGDRQAHVSAKIRQEGVA